ncbi:hypothetical protein [Brunnivagina elsteri]|uniref:Uncharacterized protein n=1 Tax=Brunnivagina elsteri CCALA 953 TaxID=987040 RepID=A0A2A2TM83_9CYAN|nr:hypothetical protein [Calothrix elsteri]PAX59431.1 hypothetical protein CK510_07005 [Calothrix elsteri CCALA 953]
MKPTCTNCKYYSQPQHDTDIACAVNPNGKACNCLSYTPVVDENLLETALVNRKQDEYEAFRRQAKERFQVEMPELSFDSNWLIPQIITKRINDFLPQVMRHEKASSYTQEQIAIAVIQWAEKQMNYHLETYDLNHSLESNCGVWGILEDNK